MALPRSLDVELEAVTPLWIGGASYQSELRAPSVRGCLRFWLRALLGGVLGEDLDNLRAAESAVYGNMQQASTVVARLTGTPRIGMIEKQDDITPGLSYMLWSVFQQKRDAILPGERFRLRLHNRPLPFPPLEVAGRTLDRGDRFELALASLWLLLRLGGVGARARRGAGGMRAVAAPEGWPDTLPPLVSAATTPGAWAAELGDGIRRLRRFARWQGPAPAEPSSFDLLHENACQLSLVDRTFESWSEALNWAGEKFQAFRVDQRQDAQGVAALLTRGRAALGTVTRAILGLPIQFFFKTLHAALVAQGLDPREARRRASATVAPSRGQARGSPLFFRVVGFPGTPARYGLLMGLFRSRFLPDHEMIIRPGDYAIKPVRVAVPGNFALIERWFQHVESQQVPLLPVALVGGTGEG